MIAKDIEDTGNHEKLLRSFRAAVHKEFKTRNPTNIEELLTRLLAAQPDLKALTIKTRDKKGRIVKKAAIDPDYLRKIITNEIKNKYE